MKKLVHKAKVRQRAAAAAAQSGGVSAERHDQDAAPSTRPQEPADLAVPGHVKRKIKKKAQFLESACSHVWTHSVDARLCVLLTRVFNACRAQDGSRAGPVIPTRRLDHHLEGTSLPYSCQDEMLCEHRSHIMQDLLKFRSRSCCVRDEQLQKINTLYVMSVRAVQQAATQQAARLGGAGRPVGPVRGAAERRRRRRPEAGGAAAAAQGARPRRRRRTEEDHVRTVSTVMSLKGQALCRSCELDSPSRGACVTPAHQVMPASIAVLTSLRQAACFAVQLTWGPVGCCELQPKRWVPA